ncbi:hypothetical protein [Halomarina oriensis]|uniref:Uncharacterized protein n=1 Tax=Halomarina oriensis TaxID=671145 RepID=A0A6B0GVJ7_9EURY|nr:hypothetical protein [Halomarina oriensis]MWG36613.1 hypothetical protein [Halomarina oriensis]
MQRRNLLKSIGCACTVALAGCSLPDGQTNQVPLRLTAFNYYDEPIFVKIDVSSNGETVLTHEVGLRPGREDAPEDLITVAKIRESDSSNLRLNVSMPDRNADARAMLDVSCSTDDRLRGAIIRLRDGIELDLAEC